MVQVFLHKTGATNKRPRGLDALKWRLLQRILAAPPAQKRKLIETCSATQWTRCHLWNLDICTHAWLLHIYLRLSTCWARFLTTTWSLDWCTDCATQTGKRCALITPDTPLPSANWSTFPAGQCRHHLRDFHWTWFNQSTATTNRQLISWPANIFNWYLLFEDIFLNRRVSFLGQSNKETQQLIKGLVRVKNKNPFNFAF